MPFFWRRKETTDQAFCLKDSEKGAGKGGTRNRAEREIPSVQAEMGGRKLYNPQGLLTDKSAALSKG